jgi:chaperonin GroEL (HSP60 family)
MREAGILLDKRLHPLVLVEGYQKALEVTLQTLESNIITIRPDSIEQLGKVAKTAMSGTSAEAGGDLMSNLVVNAAQLVAGENNGHLHISTEDVRMSKRGVGSIGDSRLIAGLIIEKRLDLDRLPKSLDAGKVVVLSCPLEI